MLCRSCHRKLHDGNGSAHIISTAARIIEHPHTKSAEAIASSHKNRDLMFVEFILCHADINGNRDEFTSEDLENNYETAIYKPINWEHTKRNIGVIYESKFISIASLSEEQRAYYQNFDPLLRDFIVCSAAIWEYKHPIEARKMRERHDLGNLVFSMENMFGIAKCSICTEEFKAFANYCSHLLDRRKIGQGSRIFKNSNFVGSAVVYDPADKGAGALALAQLENNSQIFSLVVNAKVLNKLTIENDIIPYILNTGDNKMDIRNLDIPKAFQSSTDLFDLTNESFADATNRVFSLDNEDDVENSLKLALNDELSFYNKEEKLSVIEKIVSEANKYDLNTKDYIEDTIGGNEDMNIDKNSAEFKEAVAIKVQEEVEKAGFKSKSKEDEEKLAKEKKEKEQAKAELDTLKDEASKEKEELAKEFEDYKASITAKELSLARFEDLKSKGFEFKENADFIKNSIALMKEEAFAAFTKSLEEVSEIAKASIEIKVVKEGDEDPVSESQKIAIASKVDDGKLVDKFSNIDAVFAQAASL